MSGSSNSNSTHPQDEVVSVRRLSAHDVCDLHRAYSAKQPDDENIKDAIVVAFLLYYASWNTVPAVDRLQTTACCNWLKHLVLPFATTSHDDDANMNTERIQYVVGLVQVDESEDSIRLCVGDDNDNSTRPPHPCPPQQLPVLAIAAQQHREHSMLRYIPDIPPHILSDHLRLTQQQQQQHSAPLEEWRTLLRTNLDSLFVQLHSNNDNKTAIENNIDKNDDDAIRIFVAGDRSSVGKSSVCLGLLGNLLDIGGLPPSSLAYIKPATQCEAPPLIQKFCEREGIACAPIGPIVYYKGFTRAFLAGQTESSRTLLEQVSHTVDQLAQGKRVVIVDGVGYPSVGSICGTDNAQVALACGYPTQATTTTATKRRSPPSVLLVGGSGVGGAVDAFNLNATYFDAQKVPVMGAVFNKLSTDEEGDYYSLEKCKAQVTSYFDQQQSRRRPFGFVPMVPEMATQGEDALSHADDFIRIFGKHVDIHGILDAAKQIKKESQQQQQGERTLKRTSPSPNKSDSVLGAQGSTKRRKPSSTSKRSRADDGIAVMTRKDIEQRATKAGAAASA